MADADSFWEIVANSGVDPEFEIEPEISIAELASVLQSVSEASSWLSHYIINYNDGVKIPASLYPALAVWQTTSREIIHRISHCTCKICKPPQD